MKREYISKEEVLCIVESRLNLCRKGSLEYQRLYSVMKEIKQLSGEKYCNKET